MAKSPKRGSRPREVNFSDLAQADIEGIYIYTASRWDELQAEKYLELIAQTTQICADQPALAPFSPRLNGVRNTVVRWRNARHRHRIFFRETETGIIVLRILHTSMKWQDHLIPED